MRRRQTLLAQSRVKLQHRHNTLLYYTSSCNQTNAMPLEFVCNNMPLLSSAMGSNACNEHKYACMLHVVSKPPGDSITVVGTPASSLDACNGGNAYFIVIISTSEDGDAKTTNVFQEVCAPDSNEEFDEDV